MKPYNETKTFTTILLLILIIFSCERKWDNPNDELGDAPGTQPVAAFTANQTKIIEGESVSFTDQSTNTPINWSWSFGDGGTSNSQNPSHTYSTEGTYTVSLTATNSFGSDTETKNDYITVNATGSAPVAAFTANQTTITEGESVSFTDQSINTPTSWAWSFGDGGTSNSQNPSHTYSTEGTYNVTLTATNSFGSDTETKTDYITVTTPDGYELFFSEYVEGTFNNKALEIFNPSNTEIDMSNYIMARYSNGNTTPEYVFFPDGTTIASNDVLVIVLDKRNPNATGQDTAVCQELQDKADIFLCPDYSENSMMYFNGNDAITLEKVDGNVIDIFGRVGEDPGEGWCDNESLNYMAGDNISIAWTENHTLIRKSTINQGVNVNPAFFDPSIEWELLPIDTFTNLGSHNY